MRILLAATTLLALAGCNRPAATPVVPAAVAAPPPVAPPPAPVTGAVNPPVTIANYLCTGGKTVEAGYPSATTVVVIWQGHAYTLTQAPAASGT